MKFSLDELISIAKSSRSWKLLRAQTAPFTLCFLHRAFTDKGRSSASETDLVHDLEDLVFIARDLKSSGALDDAAFDQAIPSDALSSPVKVLTKWTDEFWLTSSMPEGRSEPWYDITPDAQDALAFVQSLDRFKFVGTESRFRTLIDILRQIRLGRFAEPGEYLQELKEQRKALDKRIEDASKGIVPRLTDREIQERLQQFIQLSRSLISDFRTVEYNMRGMYRDRCIQITKWSRSKGELLENIFGEEHSIEKSDQGQSVKAFSDLLLNPDMRSQLSEEIERLFREKVIKVTPADRNLRDLYPTLLDENSQILGTIAMLSKQLKRFIDDKAYIENARIMDIIREIQRHALEITESGAPVPRTLIKLELPYADVKLPLERPLFKPRERVAFDSDGIKEGVGDPNGAQSLFEMEYIDENRLRHNINMALDEKGGSADLPFIISRFPLEHGLEELLSYVTMGYAEYQVIVDDETEDSFEWDENGMGGSLLNPNLERRKLKMKRVVISRRDEETLIPKKAPDAADEGGASGGDGILQGGGNSSAPTEDEDGR